MTLSAFFGIIASVVGLVAAGLWLYASRIKWSIERERGMLPGEYGPRLGRFFTPDYFAEGGLEPYLKAVGKWNSRAAVATAVAVFCSVCQTVTDLYRHI